MERIKGLDRTLASLIATKSLDVVELDRGDELGLWESSVGLWKSSVGLWKSSVGLWKSSVERWAWTVGVER